MPEQGTGNSGRASLGEDGSRQPRRRSDSTSDDTSTSEQPLTEDDSTAAGPSPLSAVIAAIQQVNQEVHQLLGSISTPMSSVDIVNAVDPEGAREEEEEVLSDSVEWEDSDREMSPSDFNFVVEVGIVDEEEEEEDPFENEGDLFEDESDPFVEDPFPDSDDYLHEESDSNSFESMDASYFSDDEVGDTSDEDSDLPNDPKEREALGLVPEPRVALHLAVARGDTEALRQWRGWNSLDWAKKVKGDTNLHFAARSGDVATVEQLIQDGAKLGETNKKMHTALEVAALCGHAGVVKVLLKYGAGNDSEVMEHAFLAARSPSVIQVLTDDDADAVRGVTGTEILARAARVGRVLMVRALLEAGADPNASGLFNRTALHTAASRGHRRCVAAMLAFGADVTCLDDQRWTPLHYAANHNHADVVQQLINAGSDVNVKSGAGETAYDVTDCGLVQSILSTKML